ncbi:hypothetical protein RHGRI_032381 [Rhododendron griersonianum]|uniref:Uncharacterized protein n=1 Tax=Rhododendron griersonianum TaxID=479676 RepID=A0AAV6IBI8_9ERIC|nr:hypothetical protein RHGRI_032381 [Rhododendron griersonianum]
MASCKTFIVALFIAFSLSSIHEAKGARQLPCLSVPVVPPLRAMPMTPKATVGRHLETQLATPQMVIATPTTIVWPTEKPMERLIVLWQISTF